MSISTQAEAEEDDEQSKPIVTYTFLAVIWGVFLAMAAMSHWHALNFPDQICDLFGYKQNDRIAINGHLAQWWRFITPIFLHGGLVHICVNSFSLYIIGIQLEPFYGSRRYFLVFMAAGIAGVLASFHFSHNPSLGASGALFGLVGAGIVFPLRFRSLIAPAQGKRIVIQLTKVAVVNLAIGFMLGHYVDNSAHLGGLVGGGIAALFLLPDALDGRLDRQRRWANGTLWVFNAAVFLLIGYSAIAQGRWAFGPWWKLSIPRAFRPVSRLGQFQGEWKSSDGSTVSISDTAHNPNLLPGSLYFLKRTDLPENLITVGGWHGRAYAFQSSTDTLEIYLIVVYGRVLVVTMHTSTASFPATKPQFDSLIRSIRFLHAPPPDLHPVSVVKSRPSASVVQPGEMQPKGNPGS